MFYIQTIGNEAFVFASPVDDEDIRLREHLLPRSSLNLVSRGNECILAPTHALRTKLSASKMMQMKSRQKVSFETSCHKVRTDIEP